MDAAVELITEAIGLLEVLIEFETDAVLEVVSGVIFTSTPEFSVAPVAMTVVAVPGSGLSLTLDPIKDVSGNMCLSTGHIPVALKPLKTFKGVHAFFQASHPN